MSKKIEAEELSRSDPDLLEMLGGPGTIYSEISEEEYNDLLPMFQAEHEEKITYCIGGKERTVTYDGNLCAHRRVKVNDKHYVTFMNWRDLLHLMDILSGLYYTMEDNI